MDEFNEGGNSLRDKIYLKMRANIIDGVYPSGYQLVETKLCEELGVSRTPIREAIGQLELDGLIKTIPNKGAFVTGLSMQDISDIYDIRMHIEGLASRRAAANITEEEIDKLKETLAMEEFHTHNKNNKKVLEFDSVFHDTIFKASKSKMLNQMLRVFHQNISRARTSSLSSNNRADDALQEHKMIFEAIEKRDQDLAERLTVEHIKKAKDNMLKTYKE